MGLEMIFPGVAGPLGPGGDKGGYPLFAFETAPRTTMLRGFILPNP